jgi:outer membrane lipoprotein carrier protein
MKPRHLISIFALGASLCGMAHADGLDALEAFVKTTRSGRAEFTQVVTAPAKPGVAPKTKTTSGHFEFLRPNRFRFQYTKPFEQTIVADGQTLWLFDADLNQVTARKQAQALGSTPAALIASAPDIKALQADFALQSEPEKDSVKDGVQWVLATPKAKDGQLASIRIGLKGNELVALDIEDSFGQRSVLKFSQIHNNAPMGPDVFAFKPPAGADVIRQ